MLREAIKNINEKAKVSIFILGFINLLDSLLQEVSDKVGATRPHSGLVSS